MGINKTVKLDNLNITGWVVKHTKYDKSLISFKSDF